MVNGTLLNFGKRYKDNLMVIFDQWAKVALRFGCGKQSKNLEWYLRHMHLVTMVICTKLWKEVSGKRLIGLEAQYRPLALTLDSKMFGVFAADFSSEMFFFIRGWPSYLFSFLLELKLNFKNDNHDHPLVGHKTFWSLVYKSLLLCGLELSNKYTVYQLCM